jgi:hypothetical protein
MADPAIESKENPENQTREFFVLREAPASPELTEGASATTSDTQVQGETGEESSHVQRASNMTDALLEGNAGEAAEIATQPSYEWFSVRVAGYSENQNTDNSSIQISATSVTLHKVPDITSLGDIRRADQTDTFYQLTNNKRVPTCCCFSKTVEGLVEAQGENLPTIHLLQNLTFPTDTERQAYGTVQAELQQPAAITHTQGGE